MRTSSDPVTRHWEETAFVIVSTLTFTALAGGVLYAVVRIFM